MQSTGRFGPKKKAGQPAGKNNLEVPLWGVVGVPYFGVL